MENNKKQTVEQAVEEAAKILYPENWQSIMEGKHDTNLFERDAFIAGAKWVIEQIKQQANGK